MTARKLSVTKAPSRAAVTLRSQRSLPRRLGSGPGLGRVIGGEEGAGLEKKKKEERNPCFSDVLIS